MGFLPSHLRMMIRAHRRSTFQGPVCTFGNQDTWASYQDLIDYFAAERCQSVPISEPVKHTSRTFRADPVLERIAADFVHARVRSEEHTSELQSHVNLVCRLLLEKKK